MKAPDKRWAEAAAIYATGKTTKEVGLALGAGESTTRYWLKMAGVAKRRGGHRKLAPALDRILALYASGKPMTVIGREFGVSREAIRWRIAQAGGALRSSGEARRQPDLREDAFETVTEESAYWAGFLMADGCVCECGDGQAVISMNICEVDVGHVRAFRSFLNARNKIITIPMKFLIGPSGTPICSKPQARIAICSDRLARGLAQYGVVPRKSLIAKVRLLESDRNFWRGAVDGDGWITWSPKRSDSGRVALGLCGSEALVKQFATFVRASLGREVGHLAVKSRSWHFTVSALAARQVMSILYGDCTVALPRKHAKAKKIIARFGLRRFHAQVAGSADRQRAIAACACSYLSSPS